MNSILYTGTDSSFTTEDYKVIEEAEEIIKNYDPNFVPIKCKKHLGLLIFSILFFIIFIFLAIFSTIFALLNVSNESIIDGVSVFGIDLSGLSREDAKNKITAETENRISTELVLKHNDEVYTLHPSEISVSFDIDSIVDLAYSIGRNGNIFQNNYQIFNCKIHPTELKAAIMYNNENFLSATTQMQGNFADGLINPYYEIDGNNLIVHTGKNGYVIDANELVSLFTEKMTSTNYSTDYIELPVIEEAASPIDIDQIYKEVHKEPTDAYFSTEPRVIYPSSNGLDFNISVDEAKSIITGDKDSYTIPLKVLYPNITTNNLGMEAFPDSLSTYTTSYATSDANRSTNVALATSKINGIVLMPGDEFSFNNTVGKRTPQAGFRVAGVYSGGQVTSDYGGGICQVSSTLYNAVLRANLQIVERTNHQFTVGYVPIGTDATVSWGSPDFKFKNSRTYPIKIVATTNSRKQVTISIYGLKEDNEYNVEIVSYRTGTIAYKTTYTTDKSLQNGQTKVVQSGSNGATSVAYRVLKQNGVEVSRELLSRDTYNPHNQIIARGN